MLNLFLNPKVILGILVAAIISFIAFTFVQNANYKARIKDQEDEISQLQDNITILTQGQTIQQNDIERLNAIAQYKNTIVIRENELDSKTDEIPDTLNDSPFSDPNNLRFASELRAFQEASRNPKSTTD